MGSVASFNVDYLFKTNQEITIPSPKHDPPKFTDDIAVIFIYSYIRYHQLCNSWPPKELIDLITLYYGTNNHHKIIDKCKFFHPSGYSNTVSLHNDTKCIRVKHINKETVTFARNINGNLLELRGKHCWRLHIWNPNHGEIHYGVTQYESLPTIYNPEPNTYLSKIQKSMSYLCPIAKPDIIYRIIYILQFGECHGKRFIFRKIQYFLFVIMEMR